MKKLLLHTCCAPCLAGSYDQVANDYEPIIFWYNPNIEPKSEHDKRLQTLIDYLKKLAPDKDFDCSYDYVEENKKWHDFIHGLENEPEGGERCKKCFSFRLNKAASLAQQKNVAFATTLTISPYKDTKTINAIGQEIADKRGASFLEKDFQENNGYRKSIERSKEAGLYRQKYCGCRYSITG